LLRPANLIRFPLSLTSSFDVEVKAEGSPKKTFCLRRGASSASSSEPDFQPELFFSIPLR